MEEYLLEVVIEVGLMSFVNIIICFMLNLKLFFHFKFELSLAKVILA